MTKEEKLVVIDSLAEQLQAYPHFYIADIESLNAEQTAALRRKCFESDVKLVKLPFPVNGKTGGASRRSVPMYFVTERCGRMILDIFGCSKETRAWIEGKVFACKLGKPDEQTPTELPAPTQVVVPEKPTPPPKAGSDAINRRIDAILLELLELKKYIVTAEA